MPHRLFCLIAGLLVCLATATHAQSQSGPYSQPEQSVQASRIQAPPVVPVSARVELTGTDQRLSLNPTLQVLPAEHTPDDPRVLLRTAGLAWQDGVASRSGTGLPAGSYWLRIVLHNTTGSAQDYQVVVDYPTINHIDLYRIAIPTPSGEWVPGGADPLNDRSSAQATGSITVLYRDQGANRPFTDRPSPHRKLLASLPLAAGETVMLLWRVESQPLFRFQAELWSGEAFAGHNQQRLLLFGMVYGALAVMAVYNLFLAFSVRERSYFYYVAYLLATSLLLAANEGHLAQYLWPHLSWPRLEFYTLCFALQILSFFLFSVHFLHLRRQQRPLYQLLSLLTATTLVLIVAGGLLGESLAMRAALGSSMLLYLGALAAGIRLRLAGMASAGHYVLAILSLALGLVASNLANLGMLPHSGDLQDYMMIGTVLMLTLFSLALADRINQLRRENRSASTGISKANEETQRINAELGNAREERQRLEQRLAQAREEGRAKSDYLAAISHQVRTPMNGILGMAELLKESPLDNSQLHYIHTIERSGRALVEIISELVDFADIESGNLRLALDPFDPERVVDDCLSILSLAAMEKRNNLIADVDPALPRHLRGDARKLQQVLLNLLGNAIKFTERGDVIVKVRRGGRSAVNSVELRFDVIDTGKGIASELLPHLFTPFTAHDQPGSEGRGTGLGLPISKQLIELMDGQIGVESTPGEGSRFWFTARCLLGGDIDEPRERPFTGRRVLVVEAHPILADSLERTLNGWGALVTLVGDAAAAKQMLGHHAEQSQPFDVALIDHQLPSGNGLHLAAEIAASDLATPPMILITAVTAALSAQDLASSGIEIVLEKPITHHQLKDALERALGLYHRGVRDSSRHQLPAADLPLRGMRVLVAEDNSVNQMVIAALLRRLGVEPTVVGDGLSAVNAVREQQPDAVLMDCEMPEMDGYQAARQIRSRERREGLPAVPIIALSAHATSDHQERAMAAGIDNYLTKPVTGQALETALNSVYHPASSTPTGPEQTGGG